MDSVLLYTIVIPIVIGILVIWSSFWKLCALWKAAQKKEKKWFILIGIINSAGILGIYYLYTRKGFPFERKRRR